LHNIKIRKCKNSDLGDIEDIDKLCFPGANYPRFVLRQYYDLFPDLLMAAIINEEIIAYVAGGLDCQKRGWALSLAVHPLYQNKGIGKKLLGKLIIRFEEINTKIIILTVKPENKAAQAVCKDLGFKLINTETDYFGDGDPRDVLELRI